VPPSSERLEAPPVAPQRRGMMPARSGALARYNAERARGLVHTAEWDAKMAGLQREFGAWALEGKMRE
jgi:hypothetical protein